MEADTQSEAEPAPLPMPPVLAPLGSPKSARPPKHARRGFADTRRFRERFLFHDPTPMYHVAKTAQVPTQREAWSTDVRSSEGMPAARAPRPPTLTLTLTPTVTLTLALTLTLTLTLTQACPPAARAPRSRPRAACSP